MSEGNGLSLEANSGNPPLSIETISARVTQLTSSPDYNSIRTITNELAKLFSNSNATNPNYQRSLAGIAQTVNGIRGKFLHSIPYSDNFDQLFPDRGHLYNTLMRIQYRSLDNIPFDELSDREKEIYIQSLVEFHDGHFDGYLNNYYNFGWPGIYDEKPIDRQLLEAIVQNKDKKLTEAEIARVYQAERNTYKIHLNVPPERKIEVLKAIMAAHQADQQIVLKIMDRRSKAGEATVSFSREIKAEGGRLSSVNQFKMFNNPNNSTFADFVFYPTPSKDVTAQEALVTMANEIAAILADLNLPPVDRVPRFSTPVVIDDHEIPGMTYVQGNGDLKTHIMEKYGREKLSQYYDGERNWAVRIGEIVSFNNNAQPPV